MSKPEYPKMPQDGDNSPQAKETREEIRKIAHGLHMKGWKPTRIADELGLKNRGVISTWKNRYKWEPVEFVDTAEQDEAPAQAIKDEPAQRDPTEEQVEARAKVLLSDPAELSIKAVCKKLLEEFKRTVPEHAVAAWRRELRKMQARQQAAEQAAGPVEDPQQPEAQVVPVVAANPVDPRQKTLPHVPVPPAPDTTATAPSGPTAAPAAVQPAETPRAPEQPKVAQPKAKGEHPPIYIRITPDLLALGVPQTIASLADGSGMNETQIVRALLLLGLAQVKKYGKARLLDARDELRQALDDRKE